MYVKDLVLKLQTYHPDSDVIIEQSLSDTNDKPVLVILRFDTNMYEEIDIGSY